jgi:2-polyprenyl-3-methyl-5-hydroxy-6-metoxy-1,4-benzoquinol methylase
MIIPLTYADSRRKELRELSEIAEKIHHRKHKWLKYQPYSLEYTWVIDQINNIVGNLQSKKIIDAGGGQGMVQYYLARRGATMYNVSRPADMNRASDEWTIRPGIPFPDGKPGPGIYIKANDMATVKLRGNHFDAITCISAIEHNPWNHIIECAQNLIHALKPGGPLVITVPAGKHRKWHGQFGKTKIPLYLFDAEAVQELAEALSPQATLVTQIPNTEAYQKLWSKVHAQLKKTKGARPWPYLSVGFTFVKNEVP